MLLVAVCNDYYSTMPFLFERIADYTELLMPDDLLSDSSILTATREALSEEACSDVEVIGWLYQFYISEKKDEVFAGLKKNKKVTPENIPAATQLFTPNWIVRYLVENSLGRLWMLNNPGSRLIDGMAYYIKPEQEEIDFLVIKSPEEIKICDPACGSGHMLVYAFEILYAIYEEQGYDAPKIPQLILENNLYGIEIDERAGELAAFALCMKAREKYRRFFKKNIQPNICVLENVTFEPHEVKSYLDAVNPDLFTIGLSSLLYQFKEADNFGSLIRPELTNISDVLKLIDERKVSDDIFLQDIHQRVFKVLNQADYLSPKYHIVIANPPYMGSKGMNGRLSAWAKKNFPNSKSDLFAMFIERNLKLAKERGAVAMITMQSWMFLSSFESLRSQILHNDAILTMAHLGTRAFDSIGGAVVSTTAFVLGGSSKIDFKGAFFRLLDGKAESEKESFLRAGVKESSGPWLYHASASEFMKLPGCPIAYWVSQGLIRAFSDNLNIGKFSHTFQGIITGNNEFFLRSWHEVSFSNISSEFTSYTEAEGVETWVPYSKGGNFRKWYGNNEHILRWNGYGDNLTRGRTENRQHFFKDGVTWSDVASGKPSFRYQPKSILFDAKSPTSFYEHSAFKNVISLLNTKFVENIAPILNPTMSFQIEDYNRIPINEEVLSSDKIAKIVENCIRNSKNDWDSYETSWGFKRPPLLNIDYRQLTLKATYQEFRTQCREMTIETQNLEAENNRVILEVYSLQDELTPEVPLNEITLTCNPHYRYGNDRSEEELEALILADTMRELLSYSVGCMIGRYSLEKEGLILANQGDSMENYLAKIPEPTFKPDDDNVIPVMDVDWFPDDIAERFKRFLKITFGEEYYAENLEFIEKAIGKDIRKFFLKDFYTYHVKMYKKRPIYWMFSSPKGSFNALIYMHRYRPDTVSVVLNDYLREFRTKLTARKDNLENISISTGATQGEKTKALKEIEQIKKVLDEVDDYERDILYPLATKQIEIDLDDGVKENYPKFGKALKKVAGLS